MWPSSPIKATLTSSSDSLWKACDSLVNEMPTSMTGRRIFPNLDYELSGLDPRKKYTMRMHFRLVDDKRWQFFEGAWLQNGCNASTEETTKSVWHQLGKQNGKKWMEEPLSFEQIRIVKSKGKEELNENFIHLRCHCRYVPVLEIFEGEDKLVYTQIIPYTSFVAVVNYENPRLSALKAKTNPNSISRKRKNQDPDTPKLPPKRQSQLRTVKWEDVSDKNPDDVNKENNPISEASQLAPYNCGYLQYDPFVKPEDVPIGNPDDVKNENNPMSEPPKLQLPLAPNAAPTPFCQPTPFNFGFDQYNPFGIQQYPYNQLFFNPFPPQTPDAQADNILVDRDNTYFKL